MLKIGDPIPDVQLHNQDNEVVSIRTFVGSKPIVVYFYPKNNTPGCTIEACSFRDHHQAFTELGAEVFGISGDSVSSHKSVVDKRKLQFSLLSDEKRIAEKAFGVKRNILGLLPGRVTFIVDQNGIIADIFSSATQPGKHISASLKALKTIA